MEPCLSFMLVVHVHPFMKLACPPLNPQYLWKTKMKNRYIKHGTLLMEFDDHPL